MSSDLSSIESQFNLNSVNPNPDRIYEFEDFRLDGARLILYRGAEIVNLAPKVVETLLALVESGGTIVSKEELMRRLWKDSFVEESNLTQNIYLLRKTLGRGADKRDLIETFRRRGYRFNGAIRSTPETALPGGAPVSEVIRTGDVSSAPPAEDRQRVEIALPLSHAISTSLQIDAAEAARDDPETRQARFAAPPKSGSKRLLLAVGGLFLLLAVAAFLIRLALNDRNGSESGGAAQIRSLAVMPLVIESGDSGIEYLSDGITESLITNLSQLPDLSVKARSSVFRYKGRDVPLKNIGAELSVQAILTGRIAERGNALIINVELVDALTENVLWKTDYNRSMADLSTLQSEITRDLAEKLRIKLTGANEQSLAKHNAADSETYQLYLKGRHHLNKIIPVHLNKAAAYFEQAIARDPDYAPAYAGLADTYVALAGFHGRDVQPPREFMARAKEAAQKAVRLDAQSAIAQIAYANVAKALDYDFEAAERACQIALKLDPSNPDAHSLYADVLFHKGRDEEALAEHRRALELDPLSMQNSIKFGFFLVNTGRDAEAEAQMKKTIDLDPKLPTPHFVLYRLYMAKGMHARSVEEYTAVGDILGYAETTKKQRDAFARGGWEEFLKFEIARSLEGQKSHYVRASDIAINYAQLGDRDKAFEYLEKALANREPMMGSLRRNRILESLHADPRYAALVRRAETR